MSNGAKYIVALFIQGQCFIAVDPDAFAPGFGARMQDLMDMMRSLETVK